MMKAQMINAFSGGEHSTALVVAAVCLALVCILLLTMVVRAIIRKLSMKRRYGRVSAAFGHRKQRRRHISRRKYGKFEYHGYTGPKRRDKK